MPFHHQSPYMQDQFTFIHDAILESVTCGDTQIAATNLRTTIAKMKRNDSKNQPHGFQYQFKVCMSTLHGKGSLPSHFSLCRSWSRFLPTLRRFTVVGHSTAQTEIAVTNIFLVSFHCELGCLCYNNYHILFFPADRWRVVLKGEQPDYIHAVNINVSLEMISMNRNAIT